MAQQTHSINLQNTIFPMLTSQQKRTIINTRDPKELPSIAYCHNVMPTSYGFQSVGYTSKVTLNTLLPEGAIILDVRIIYGDDRSRVYISWDNLGNAYILPSSYSGWIQPTWDPSPLPLLDGPESISIATVNGISYIQYSGSNIFKYDESAQEFVVVTTTGISLTGILGIVGSNGYLIAYTTNALAWSSTIDPLDFVPSPVTGAGGGNVDGLAGKILFVTANANGLLIYTETNVVAGLYTGNSIYPFKFKEVKDSKGGISIDQVAYEANAEGQYVYSKAGIQNVNSQFAETILPEVTDFLAGRRLEDYDETTREFVVYNLSALATFKKKIKYIASRYLIVSYSINLGSGFTHALIFDIALSKLGKLRVDHTDIIEFIGNQTEPSKESIGIVTDDGTIKIVTFDLNVYATGVLILGKVQFSHSRRLCLEKVEVENITPNVDLQVGTQAFIDGNSFTDIDGYLAYSNNEAQIYNFHTDAVAHSIVFIGDFSVNSVLVTYQVTGRT